VIVNGVVTADGGKLAGWALANACLRRGMP